MSENVLATADTSSHQAETMPTNDLKPPLRLGERLLAEKLISEQDLQRGLEFQTHFGGRLGAVLMRLGSVSEDALLSILSVDLDMPLLKANNLPFDAAPLLNIIELSGIQRDWWLDQEIVAWQEMGAETVYCLTRDPLDDSLHEILEYRLADYPLCWMLGRTQDLERMIELLEQADGGLGSQSLDDVGHLRELAEGAPVVEFVNNMLAQAIDRRASDVHIEPEESRFYVRYRTDGVLQEHLNLPRERFDAIASRIKLIADLDIAERRLPQDGRLNTRVSGQEIDIRVSTLPGVHGESIVMRLLPKERETNRLEQLGMASDHYADFSKWVAEPHGIILVTGPTGSGKSTTLYATLDAINNRTRKIITVEDPVEYQLPHITQVQAHSEIGFTFSAALRSILRQDPDVIMIGEIRDLETAEIAIQASLTGHMVLSTLHTNDAISAFTRLIDMGIEPFLVTTSVRAVQAQRLVRTLCKTCAEPHQPNQAILDVVQQHLPQSMQNQASNFKQAMGCEACQHTGYKGRVGIYELVYVTPELQQLLMQGAHINELQSLARSQGYRSLRQDGFLKAFEGVTSVEEVLRVTESV